MAKLVDAQASGACGGNIVSVRIRLSAPSFIKFPFLNRKIIQMFDVFFGFALLATSTVANKYALAVLPLSLMVGLRMFGAGIILLAYYRKKTHRLKFEYFKHDLGILLLVSLLTMLIPALFKAYALKNMLASKSAFIASLDPFVTALYSYLLWKEHLTYKKIIGIILGFSGTLILLFSTTKGAEQNLMAWSIFSYPEIAAFLAMAIGRMGWMIVQQLLKKERYSAGELNGLLMTSSGVMAFSPILFETLMLILSYIPGIGPLITQAQLYDTHNFLHLNMNCAVNYYLIIFAVLYTIVLGNVIGYTMYASFLRHHSATFVALAGFSVPLYVYLFSNLLLGEPLSINFLYASAITFVGLLIFYQDEIAKISVTPSKINE